MIKRFERVTPTNTGFFKRSWDVKLYPNVNYIYNPRGPGGLEKGIPLTQVSEYSRRGPKPFVFKTWERNKSDILNIFKKEFERRLK